MTLSLEVSAQIRRLHFAEKWPINTIAVNLRVHPDAVRRIVGVALVPPRGRLLVRARIEPYSDFIKNTLDRYPGLRATRIYDMIQERGFDGSARTVRRYLQDMRPKRRDDICLRPQPLIGEQTQIDWMHIGKVSVGASQKRDLWAFVMVLCHSRAIWAELLFDMTAHGVRRSLLRGARYFGGCTREWLFDNPKTVVVERSGETFRFNEILLETASQLCVQPRLCAVRHPQSKGRVERAIRYLRDRFFAGRSFVSMEVSSSELRRFLIDIAPTRCHPEITCRTVADVFADERPRLMPLPEVMPAEEATVPGIVSAYGLVTFDTNRYSIPSEMKSGPCLIAFTDTSVRIIIDGREASAHERCWGKKMIIEKPEHRQKHGERRPLGKPNVVQNRLRHVEPRIDQLFSRWVEEGRNVGNMTIKTAEILDQFGDAIFQKAVDSMLDAGTHDPSRLFFICEKIRKDLRITVKSPVIIAGHAVDCDVNQHQLGDYDV